MSYSFYELLPAIIKLRDAISSGQESDTLLQKIFYMLDQEADWADGKINTIYDLIDPNDCPEEYLPMLATLVDFPLQGGWTEDKKRMAILGAVKLYCRKGVVASWRAVLAMFGHPEMDIQELYKNEIHPVDGYSTEKDYFDFPAARIDLTEYGSTILPPDTDPVWQGIELMRPIHVLVRRDLVKDETQDAISASDSTEAGSFSKITDCAGMLSDGDVTLPGEECQVGLQISSYACTNFSCEATSCETFCEGSCESICETECETSCQIGCENVCQTFCEGECESFCEGTCTVSCQVWCQLYCQQNCQYKVQST